MVPREVHVADNKFLALILRHKLEEIGISLDEHGWAATSSCEAFPEQDPLLATCSRRL